MEREAPAIQILPRDRAVTLGALALVVALSWATLLRAPSHAEEGPAAPVAAAELAPPTTDDTHASGNEAESEDDSEEGVPRFP